jgi:aldose 1-epimerase
MKMRREQFGRTRDGKQVDRIEIENENGYSCAVLTYGAYLCSFKVPDSRSGPTEVTRCFPHFTPYENPKCYFGATIGRYANRIAGPAFSIDGKTSRLTETSPGVQLHGGPGGFHTRIWDAYPLREENRASVKLTLHSSAGDQGFPGSLDAVLTVTLTDENELIFLYEAEADAPTPVSLTNHTYWNLRGEFFGGSIYDQEIRIFADSIVEVDGRLLPTGVKQPVDGYPFDLRTPTPIGRHIDVPNGGTGYDNCFIVKDPVIEGEEVRPLLRDAAAVYDPESNRSMIVRTTAPGVQFFTDNVSQPPHTAYCLEAGELPDAMNQADFPSPVIRPGELYRQVTIHSFGSGRPVFS